METTSEVTKISESFLVLHRAFKNPERFLEKREHLINPWGLLCSWVLREFTYTAYFNFWRMDCFFYFLNMCSGIENRDWDSLELLWAMEISQCKQTDEALSWLSLSRGRASPHWWLCTHSQTHTGMCTEVLVGFAWGRRTSAFVVWFLNFSKRSSALNTEQKNVTYLLTLEFIQIETCVLDRKFAILNI